MLDAMPWSPAATRHLTAIYLYIYFIYYLQAYVRNLYTSFAKAERNSPTSLYISFYYTSTTTRTRSIKRLLPVDGRRGVGAVPQHQADGIVRIWRGHVARQFGHASGQGYNLGSVYIEIEIIENI